MTFVEIASVHRLWSTSRLPGRHDPRGARDFLRIGARPGLGQDMRRACRAMVQKMGRLSQSTQRRLSSRHPTQPQAAQHRRPREHPVRSRVRRHAKVFAETVILADEQSWPARRPIMRSGNVPPVQRTGRPQVPRSSEARQTHRPALSSSLRHGFHTHFTGSASGKCHAPSSHSLRGRYIRTV